MKRILFVGNCYTTVVHFRKELIEALVNYGYDVWISFPNHSHGEKETGEEAAEKLRCRFRELKMDRRSANPLKEVSLLWALNRLIRDIKPDCVLTFTVKPNIYCGYACYRMHIPYIMNITGLGSGIGTRGLGKLLVRPYINSANKARRVFFQNSSDYSFFISYGFKDTNTDFLPGSGVNLDEYHVLPYPKDKKTVFLYNARVMKEKGIDEFLYVAKQHELDENVEFHICGDCEDKYEEELRRLEEKRVIYYHGRVSNMKKYIGDCNCLVLPSYYHEGISNCLLEASACGRPIITTDHPGCREVVNDGVNGYLVNKQDGIDLDSKINRFIGLSYTAKEKMGLEGRKKVENEFDRNVIIERYLDVINKII